MKNTDIQFFVREYNEENWKNFSNCFSNVNLCRDSNLKVPKDILKCLVGLLGEENALKWIELKFEQLEGKTAIELSQNDIYLKALKAFIMRMPN
jgi:hypothetical protein